MTILLIPLIATIRTICNATFGQKCNNPFQFMKLKKKNETYMIDGINVLIKNFCCETMQMCHFVIQSLDTLHAGSLNNHVVKVHDEKKQFTCYICNANFE